MFTDPLTKLVVALALVVAWTLGAFSYGRHVEHLSCTNSADKKTIERQNVATKITGKVIEEEHKDDQQTQKVDQHVQDQLTRTQATVRSLSTANDGLRAELSRVRADAMSQAEDRASLVARVSALTDVLGECSNRYSEMAEQADKLAIQVAGWQELEAP